jgi:hypothetical protein
MSRTAANAAPAQDANPLDEAAIRASERAEILKLIDTGIAFFKAEGFSDERAEAEVFHNLRHQILTPDESPRFVAEDAAK